MSEGIRAGADKQATVNNLRENLANAPLVALVNYEKITVDQVNTVRRAFETKGIRYMVAKNTLINLAVKGTEREDMGEYLAGMTGVIISNEDGIETAKFIRETVK
jgi:large subunit ribosomal protein L10